MMKSRKDNTLVHMSVARDIIRDYGTGYFFREVLPWHFVRRYDFFSQSLKDFQPKFSCEIPFHLDLASERDMPLLLKVRPGYYRLSALQERLRSGHLCFLGWSGQEPIHIRWVFRKSKYLSYLHREIVLSPGEAYLDEGYTVSRYRKNRVFLYAGDILRREIKQMGLHTIHCVFASWHYILRELASQTGMKKTGEWGYTNILGLRHYFSKGSPRDLDKGRIEIRIDRNRIGQTSPSYP